ncbi:type IV pilin N-terminal domain-containing protein [Haloarcula onubensis]|uniref:Type IV pilin N-terminal domain-containing protein n=1 Tax=Haloarcula onubensis TaxID=2950539 RepID=A0ABU2FUW6_9EURY|nr:type IV pilin N-terminal domain-containing protein [Halomicroarcula sp. S3CR25-11]MDS0284209.1 type IV pilin N-terminal domain-containing protein [Halomicroarcula sp. S3CR25-11]
MGGALSRADRAVSPVVGVTLMIVITVVLAATTAAFALGLNGTGDDTPPQGSFTYDYTQTGNGELRVAYEGGDTLDPSTVRIETAGGAFCPAPGNTSSSCSSSVSELRADSEADGNDWVGSDIEAGTTFGIFGDSSNMLETATVRIVWVDPSVDRTVVLGEWQGPAA